jgi:signal transduction histidine kinase/ActR/RegA family two-component response regulator
MRSITTRNVHVVQQGSAVPTDGVPLRRSLRLRLPLLFALFVIATLGAFLFLGYREMVTTLEGVGRHRADEAASEVSGTLSRGISGIVRQQRGLANEPEVRAFLANPADAAARAAAVAALEGGAAPALRRIELWTADRRRVLEIAHPSSDTAGFREYPTAPPPADTGVSALHAAGEHTYFTIVVEARDEDGALLGYLRRYGRITASVTSLITNLLGDEARIVVGMPGEGVWTDFVALVEPPPGSPVRDGDAISTAPDGTRWVGGGMPIESTPWVVWAGYPRRFVVAPATAFLQQTGLAALVLLGLSVTGVSLLSYRLTQPLRALVDAARHIAAGDYSRRVPSRGRDEIGHLSTSFNTMAGQVEDAHRTLLEINQLTHFALAAARIGVWEADLTTGRVRCSDSLALVHGLPREALPETVDEFVALVHAEDRPALRGAFEGGSRGRGVFDLQCRTAGPDAAGGWVEVKGTIRHDESGAPDSVLGVSIDVTDRRRLEAQLRQSQKMEAVGQLAGGVAHDFNNLLTAILGHGSMLLSEIPDQAGPREDVMAILHAAESAAGLTRQLLTFSRREVGQPRVIAVNPLIARTEELLRRLIGVRVRIELDLDPGVKSVRADAVQLEQILVNLAVNARDAMPDGGTITIRTAMADLDEDGLDAAAEAARGRYLMIEVTDTGTGMSEETRKRLFEPFFTTKPAGEGTGLGLATVFGIVKQAGGHISVTSEPGEGTSFRVYLPPTDEPAAQAQEATAARREGGDERILVVEDDPAVRRIVCSMLERMGYEVVSAVTGEDALLQLATMGIRPELVVTDVEMPGMSGPELVKQIEARYPEVRAIYTSGSLGGAAERYRLPASGANFIAKPYSPDELARKVREALGAEAKT